MLRRQWDLKGLGKGEEKILLKDEKGVSKELVTIQPNFSPPKDSGINYQIIYQFVNTKRVIRTIYDVFVKNKLYSCNTISFFDKIIG